MKKIETLKELSALISETYMYAIVVSLVALVIAFLIANLIKWEGGKEPRDHVKRLIWFIILGIVFPIGFFLYNSLIKIDIITKDPLKASFLKANIWATLLLIGIYVVLGILTMLIFRKSKWGSILGQLKK